MPKTLMNTSFGTFLNTRYPLLELNEFSSSNIRLAKFNLYSAELKMTELSRRRLPSLHIVTVLNNVVIVVHRTHIVTKHVADLFHCFF